MSLKPTDRPIRSFVIRASRATGSQRKALEQHWDTHVIPYEAGLLDIKKHFTDTRPLTVEIGFGMGDSLLKMAQADPQSNFLGIEVHRPGVGKLLHGIAQHNLHNLKIMCHDATEVIANCFDPQSVNRLLIFFPDPWPKNAITRGASSKRNLLSCWRAGLLKAAYYTSRPTGKPMHCT